MISESFGTLLDRLEQIPIVECDENFLYHADLHPILNSPVDAKSGYDLFIPYLLINLSMLKRGRRKRLRYAQRLSLIECQEAPFPRFVLRRLNFDEVIRLRREPIENAQRVTELLGYELVTPCHRRSEPEALSKEDF